MIKLIFISIVLTSVLGRKFSCNHDSVVNTFKRPTYDFSVQLLDRVAQETKYHFVFSPLSTWLQLMTLAEGARGLTEREIRKVTRYHRMLCFRRKYKEVINGMDEELDFMTKRKNVIIFNKFLDIKNTYKNEIQRSNSTKVLLLNFNNPDHAAAKVNEMIEMDMDGLIKESVQPEDFHLAVMLMTETAYFKSDWKSSFNPVYTSKEPFYSEERISVGNVHMMAQIGYFNLTEMPSLNAIVLELPFNTNDRISMLVFLPTTGSVQNLLYYLKDIRLMAIYNRFKTEGTKLVTVKIPKFNIETELVNIPELVYDMGVKRIFYPDLADFRGISDYTMSSSLMKQIASIEVTEKGATAGAIAEPLLEDHNAKQFKANSPFLYLIADRKTDIILFGGIYSKPNSD